jgi:hypothetical protein
MQGVQIIKFTSMELAKEVWKFWSAQIEIQLVILLAIWSQSNQKRKKKKKKSKKSTPRSQNNEISYCCPWALRRLGAKKMGARVPNSTHVTPQKYSNKDIHYEHLKNIYKKGGVV